MNDELNEVRAQLQDSQLFSPAVLAQLDALRASVHEQLRDRGIDPTSRDYEAAMVVGGGAVAQFLASPTTTLMLANVAHDVQRGGVAALLFWLASISPHPVGDMTA